MNGMNRSIVSLAFAAVSAAAYATATIDPDTNILTFHVETGDTEQYTTALTSSIAGIEKTGDGTIVLSTATTAFTGKAVNIRAGALQIGHKDALGSGNTVTVANGAQYRMIYDTAQNNTDGQNNDIVLQGGDGPDHTGAIYATAASGNAAGDYFYGNVTLEADSTVMCVAARGFGRTLDLGGNVLTLKGPARLPGSGTTVGKVVTVKNPGKIRVASGQTVLQGTPVFEGEGVIESAGGSLQMWNLANPMPWKLKVSDANLTLNMGRGFLNSQSANPAANIWQGDVEIGSGRTLSLTGSGKYKTDYITIAGKITGEGSISIGADAEFRLTGTQNDYSGGTAIGGNTFKLFADGNISTNGPVKLSGGVLEVHLENDAITSEYMEGLANAMSHDSYSSGNGTLRFITGAAQSATLTSDLSAMHPSISLVNYGDGTLELGGELPSGAMLHNRTGRFSFSGDWSRLLWSLGCSGGTMDVKGGRLWRGYYDGSRNFKVGSSNDVTSARLRVLDGGTLYFPCKEGGDVSESFTVADEGAKPAILEIHDGATVTAKVTVAWSANTRGAVYQYGGDVGLLSHPGNDESIGYYGQAYWWMNGGTLKDEHADPFLVLANRTGSEGQIEVQGGEVKLAGGNSLLIGRGASRSELYLGGGTADINQIRMGGDLLYSADHGADAGGQAVLTLSGTNNPSLTASTVRLNERTNEFTSVVNLNAGLLTVGALFDCTLNSANRSGCRSFVNFNGGALRFNGTKNVFSSGHPTRITVFGGGATLEFTQSADHSPDMSLLAPEGRGIKSIVIPDGAITSGYAMPPVVYISGGGGEGATAHVRFDPRTGSIDREIEVTSPGWGFTEAPTVTITAPDMETVVVCEVELTGETQVDGGLTLRGIDGVNSARNFVPTVAGRFVYSGPTVVEPGITFYPRVPGVSNPFSTSKELRMAGGAYSGWNVNPVWRRLGGFGNTRAWDPNRVEVSDALFFRAQDLEQGLYLIHDAGRLTLSSGCVVEIDDFDALTGDIYTLVHLPKTHANNYLAGTPKFADDVAAANPRWRLVFSSDRKKLCLRRIKGMALSLR